MLNKQHELAALNGVPLSSRTTTQTVNSERREKDCGAAIAAIFEKITQCCSLSNPFGVNDVDGTRKVKYDNVQYRKIGTGTRELWSVALSHIPAQRYK